MLATFVALRQYSSGVVTCTADRARCDLIVGGPQGVRMTPSGKAALRRQTVQLPRAAGDAQSGSFEEHA